MAMKQKVVLFLIDGMRPDGLQQANTPTIDNLIAAGAHTMAGRTVMPSATLPCITSLFLGVPPQRHGITTNIWMPLARPVPGLIDVVHRAGGRTASFFNWEELRDLSRPGALNLSFYLKNSKEAHGRGDTQLADLAASWLGRDAVDFAFVYLGYTDIAGHAYGWMSEPYLQGIANADRCVARVLNALPQDIFVIVTSDHGGHDQTHGLDCQEDIAIPFVMSGPGIPASHSIERPVNIVDIAPTVAHLLGLDAPAEWVGTPLRFSGVRL